MIINLIFTISYFSHLISASQSYSVNRHLQTQPRQPIYPYYLRKTTAVPNYYFEVEQINKKYFVDNLVQKKVDPRPFTLNQNLNNYYKSGTTPPPLYYIRRQEMPELNFNMRNVAKNPENSLKEDKNEDELKDEEKQPLKEMEMKEIKAENSGKNEEKPQNSKENGKNPGSDGFKSVSTMVPDIPKANNGDKNEIKMMKESIGGKDNNTESATKEKEPESEKGKENANDTKKEKEKEENKSPKEENSSVSGGGPPPVPGAIAIEDPNLELANQIAETFGLKGYSWLTMGILICLLGPYVVPMMIFGIVLPGFLIMFAPIYLRHKLFIYLVEMFGGAVNNFAEFELSDFFEIE